jgi:hypothetical protein
MAGFYTTFYEKLILFQRFIVDAKTSELKGLFL